MKLNDPAIIHRRLHFRLCLALIGVLSISSTYAETVNKSDPFQAHIYMDSDGHSLPYRLVLPDDSDHPMPVLIFLHGAGERGNDNERQLIHGRDLLLKAANEFGCMVVVPQCPTGQKWSIIDWSQENVTFSEEPSEPMRLVMSLLEDLAGRYSVDRDRWYIMGLSMGGFGTWDAICRWPDRFAAAVAICGGGDPAKAPLLVNTPVWAFHGDTDPVVMVDLSRSMIHAIRQAGGNPRYTEYPGVGHNSWTPAFAEPDLLPWLTSHRLNHDDCAEPEH